MRINKNLETSEIVDFDPKYLGELYVTATMCMDNLYLGTHTLSEYKSLGNNLFDCGPDPWVVFCGVNEAAKKMLEKEAEEFNRGIAGHGDLIRLLKGGEER